MASSIRTIQWSGKWPARLNLYNLGSMLAVNCGSAGFSLERSVVPHKHAGEQILLGCPIGTGEWIGYYYRLLVHCNPGGQEQMKQRYSEGVMVVTVE